jgi:hypothetical protein
MVTQFNTIVVPADLSQNTGTSIQKALELADPGATVHLIYVQKLSLFESLKSLLANKVNPKYDSSDIERKLQEWRKVVETNPKKVNGCVWISIDSSVQKGIEKIAKKVGADLIIISKRHRHSWFFRAGKIRCSGIARRTGIAVLTVTPGSLQNDTRKIVVPMTRKVPEEKMNIINGISRKFKLRIFLVSFSEKESGSAFSAGPPQKTQRWLSTSFGCPVEYTVLRGDASSAALLKYTKSVEANTLLVFAGSETETRFARRDISDIIKPGSNIEVLMIKQQSVS